MNLTNMLTIGEIAKLTGAGKKSLRYYERINILKPAYTSSETGYRYYTIDQVRLVEVIKFCIELDIPLADLTKFIEPSGKMDFRKFFKEGRAIAENKLKALKSGLKLLASLEQQMDLAEMHTPGQRYTREIAEKYFHVKPCGKSLSDSDHVEILKSLWEMPEVEYDTEISEYGILREQMGDSVMYYYFVEVPQNFEMDNIMVIPRGEYLCMQNENGQIEQAAEIFKKELGESFIAIEIEILTGKSNVNKPIRELRVISLCK